MALNALQDFLVLHAPVARFHHDSHCHSLLNSRQKQSRWQRLWYRVWVATGGINNLDSLVNVSPRLHFEAVGFVMLVMLSILEVDVLNSGFVDVVDAEVPDQHWDTVLHQFFSCVRKVEVRLGLCIPCIPLPRYLNNALCHFAFLGATYFEELLFSFTNGFAILFGP